MDDINKHYGTGTLRIAAEGKEQKWALRRKFLSKSYTTTWSDIIKVT